MNKIDTSRHIINEIIAKYPKMMQKIASNPNYLLELYAIGHSVLAKIPNKTIAYQFVMEELDGASMAINDNIMARIFVEKSGFCREEYKGAMDNSFDEVDGPNGPQVTLRLSAMPLAQKYGDIDFMVFANIFVVEGIMDVYKLGIYSADYKKTKKSLLQRFFSLLSGN